MAVSVASSLLLLPLPQSSTYVPNKRSYVSFSIPAVAVGSLSLSRQRHVAIRAIEEENAGEVESEPSEVSMEIGDETNVTVEKTPKKFNGANKKKNNRVRIKLKSYFVPIIEDTCKQILEVARTTNSKTVGPVPLPTKKRIYCVLKSPHKHKDAREHFEIRTHIRLIDIIQPTLETVEALSLLEFPAGISVKLKI